MHRRSLLIAAGLLALAPLAGGDAPVRSGRAAAGWWAPSAALHAQVQPTRRQAPAERLADVEAVFNAPLTRRGLGRTTVSADETLPADLAVLDGPLIIAGQIRGSVVAVNANVVLESTAVIDGSLVIVGGTLEQQPGSRVDGSVQLFTDRVAARMDGSRLTIGARGFRPSTESGDRLVEWWERIRQRDDRSNGFTVTSGGTYNRVEGLAILAGPRLRRPVRDGSVSLEVLGIARTADRFRWDGDNLGHRVTTELAFGEERQVAVGAILHDVVAPVEDWHLAPSEVGLGAFFLQRDFRDYFNRHGAELFARVTSNETVAITARYADERWGAREQRDVLALFQGERAWRPNAAMDAGRVRIGGASITLDTRNDPGIPWAGWHIAADYEFGSGRLTRVTVIPGTADPLDGRSTWGRGFLDVRKYNRISPTAQLNLRGVLAGWLHGDALPLQRRVSLGGPGTLPGYDFREPVTSADRLTCTDGVATPGRPALCDRVVLVQADYRGDLPVPRARWLDAAGGPRTAAWVVFADAGRGWLVVRGPGDLRERRAALPTINGWLSDVGAGVELGALGLYIAKAVSTPGQPLNVFLRLGHRF